MKVNLPVPPPRYDATSEGQRNLAIEKALGRVFVSGERIEAGVPGVVLTAPNGTRWLLTVSNAGVLGATAL